ncbi:hypothetical protein [Herbiconiux solani]|uniref:hypothetical protein n=1 Tax=Herbiconiux solani TaxID=661329 RepID=UPI000825855B|nr:hypothetical protein [Herbiconiux solani]
MTEAIDDPTQRPQTLQRPRGGVDPTAVISLAAGVVGIVLLVIGVDAWVPLLLAAIGLFVALISVMRSRPSGARWVSTIAIAVSLVPFLVMFFQQAFRG